MVEATIKSGGATKILDFDGLRRSTTIIVSIVLTCRKIGIDPIEHLSWVLPRIDKTLNSQRRTLLRHA